LICLLVNDSFLKSVVPVISNNYLTNINDGFELWSGFLRAIISLIFILGRILC